ncbi:cytochrome c-type biogenesis protein [Candidatus Marithrix sp. Canyon 246]|uniref:cytochrome c-type biogenesis protein n=1 Tax=Candidatus Marithrix sp. Canyon 246 TaxID=1827136 RepID=UPI00084A09C4|nr:cytochrome c-type biogenesis protein [Candidatus Marithrix sp. Canyon 246]
MNKLNLFFLLLIFNIPIYAIDKNPINLDNAEQEARYQKLTNELRCVVCQNQSVADSNAELAQDVRNLVRNQISEGQTNEQISAFLVQRYGDFVLYNPPLTEKTYILWLGPFILMLFAFIILMFFIRRQTKAKSVALTDAERDKLNQALGK